LRTDGYSILISVPHGAAAGNMLRTGIVRRVLDADAGVRIVIVSPMAGDAEFVREVAHPRVTFEPLPPHQPAGIEAHPADGGAGEGDDTLDWPQEPHRALAGAVARRAEDAL
jgi:hypothetical protein